MGIKLIRRVLHCVGATLTELVHFDNSGYPIQWFWMDLNLGNWYPTMTENVYSKCWLSKLGWDGKETNPFPWPGLRVGASQWIWWISDQLTTIAPLWVPIIDHCNWHRYQTTHSEYLSYLSSDQRMDKPLNPLRCTIWMILIWSTFSWNFSWCLSNPSNNNWTEALNFC